MAKFMIIKKGKNNDKSFWFLITREDDGFIETAICKKTTDVTTKELEVPESKIDKLNWKM